MKDLREIARRVLEVEAEGILGLRHKLDSSFERAVELLAGCEGKVVVSGMGKSGIVARKLASTLTSTGTPAVFLHPAEGAHGDLGVISRRDVALLLSNSGETEEVLLLLPPIKRMGVKLVVMTGNPNSTLARSGDVVLDVGVPREACSWGIVPTASVAAAMAMGDALAIALLERKGVRPEDFALVHPGGALGRRLLLRVADLMHTGDRIPLVGLDTPMREALVEMTTKRLGITGVCDAEGNLRGVITDGDLRRALERDPELLSRRAEEIMTTDPRTIGPDALAAEALRYMERYAITCLFVVPPGQRRAVGVVHMHDLLRAGIA